MPETRCARAGIGTEDIMIAEGSAVTHAAWTCGVVILEKFNRLCRRQAPGGPLGRSRTQIAGLCSARFPGEHDDTIALRMLRRVPVEHCPSRAKSAEILLQRVAAYVGWSEY